MGVGVGCGRVGVKKCRAGRSDTEWKRIPLEYEGKGEIKTIRGKRGTH